MCCWRWIWMMVLGGLLTGCDRRTVPQDLESAAGSPKGSGYVALIAAGRDDPLWPIIRQGAERYASSPASHQCRFLVPEGNSVRHQVHLLNSLTDPDMRGVCVQIADLDPLLPVLNDLHTRGVRIVSMMQPVPVELRVAHVGFDETALGEALAEATATAIHGEGDIMVLHAGQSGGSYAPRLAGFEQAILRYPRIQVFASLDCRRNPIEARRLIRERSERFPRLSAWVSLDDWPLRDVGEPQSPLPPGCRMITVGGLPGQWPLIAAGNILAVVAANYREIGERAAEFCANAIKHPPRFTKVYEIPLRIVTPTNLDEYERDWTFWSTGRYPHLPTSP